MPRRFTQLISAAALGALMLAAIDAGTAQDPKPIPLFPPGGAQPQPDPNAPPEGTEVLAKGPVHEAFATTAEAPTPEPIVAKQPPEPIEELPPDQKPEGDNVQWIPGYWDWDEEGARFLWVSGCWRDTPPGRVWVPGSWREVRGGWQWVSGFWQEPSREEPTRPELTYLPEPLPSLEVGPSVAAPSTTSFYVPGSWVWRNKYVWRPGVWVEYRPNWIWVPAHFRWTPLGYVFVEGYWDYTLAQRGVLFAPIVFTGPVRPAYVYTPVYVVSEPCLVGALFVRRGSPNYYFGDYFEPRYVTRGYNPWAGRVTGVTFTIGFGGGRNWGYDPLWSHYAVSHRADRDWNSRVNTLYTGRYAGNVARPPVTLTQQNTVINKITNVNVTNVTNNITVDNRTVTVNKQNVTDVAMIAPVSVAKNLQPEARIRPVTAEVRRAEAQTANQTREVGVQRNKAESAAVAKLPPAPAKQPAGTPAPVAQPQSLKLEVPKAAVARSQIKDEKKAPPPPAIKAEAKVEPKGNPKLDPKFDPKMTPKVDPKPKDPMPDPKSKFDPKTDPKVDPKPKGEPKTEPKTDPKGEPKPKVDPKPKDPVPLPNPKGEPKPKDPVPVPMPKGEPKKVDPQPVPMPNPKVEPKPKDPVPVPMPKVEPKPKDPAPVPLPVPKGEPKPKDPAPAPKGEPKPKDPAPPVPLPNPKDPAPPVPPPVPKGEPKPKDPVPVPKGEPKPKDPAPPVPKGEPKGPVVPPPKIEPKKKDPVPAPAPAPAPPKERN